MIAMKMRFLLLMVTAYCVEKMKNPTHRMDYHVFSKKVLVHRKNKMMPTMLEGS